LGATFVVPPWGRTARGHSFPPWRHCAYLELMGHRDAVQPEKVVRVQHEELVEDFEANVRRILKFVGLVRARLSRVLRDRTERA